MTSVKWMIVTGGPPVTTSRDALMTSVFEVRDSIQSTGKHENCQESWALLYHQGNGIATESVSIMSRKRTLDSFFQSTSPKRPRLSNGNDNSQAGSTSDTKTSSDLPPSNHSTYPYPVPQFPSHLANALSEVPAAEGKELNEKPDLDLLYFQPFIPKSIERDLFHFLRRALFFYRVQYKIKRGPTETEINTPR